MIDLSKIREIADKYPKPWNEIIKDILSQLIISSESGQNNCRVNLEKLYYKEDGLNWSAYVFVYLGVKQPDGFFKVGEFDSIDDKDGFLDFLKSQLAEVLKISLDSFSLTVKPGRLFFKKL